MRRKTKFFTCTFAIMVAFFCAVSLSLVAQATEATGVVVQTGAFPDGDGIPGAQWRLYDCDSLVVTGGFVVTGGWLIPGPWHTPLQRNTISTITFTGPVTTGETIDNLFRSLRNVTEINGLAYFNTHNTESMRFLFSDAYNLTSLDLSNFDTSNVWGMDSMFAGMSNLTSLDLSNFDTSNVRGMGSMFAGMSNLTSLDLSNFDTSNVRRVDSMFAGMSNLTSLDLSNFDTSNVRHMTRMFANSTSLTNLDLSGFDISNVRYMSGMFYGTYNLISLDLSSFDTSSERSFFNVGTIPPTSPITLTPIGGYDVTNVYFPGVNPSGHRVAMGGMFAGATSLRRLTLGEHFSFYSTLGIGMPSLPDVPTTEIFTGKWQNVGTGTVTNPFGEHVFTSAQLMEYFDGSTMADTWVWQTQFSDDSVQIYGGDFSLWLLGESTRQLAVLPASYSSAVTWETSDPTVATVDANGIVTAISRGTATISAIIGITPYDVVTVTVTNCNPSCRCRRTGNCLCSATASPIPTGVTLCDGLR